MWHNNIGEDNNQPRKTMSKIGLIMLASALFIACGGNITMDADDVILDDAGYGGEAPVVVTPPPTTGSAGATQEEPCLERAFICTGRDSDPPDCNGHEGYWKYLHCCDGECTVQ